MGIMMQKKEKKMQGMFEKWNADQFSEGKIQLDNMPSIYTRNVLQATYMFIRCIMNVGNASADNNNGAFTLGVRDSRVESPKHHASQVI
jgi:hypothetical protein